MTRREKAAVIGGGSWGTALAVVLAGQGYETALWALEPAVAAAINGVRGARENTAYLAGVPVPEGISATNELETAVERAASVWMAVPSHALRATLEKLQPLLEAETPLLLATKGLERGTLLRVSEVAAAVLGPATALATLSGPTFAREVAGGEPAAIVVASADARLAAALQSRFSSPTLRLYTSGDVIGVELGASLKNVIAIAAGICQGLGLGSNTRAALIARGLAEMTRLACACGGRAETLAGLAGLGDLVLTCTGELSRNRAVGIGLGEGRRLPEILSASNTVAEGVPTTAAAVELARRHLVEMPIVTQMHRVLYEGLAPGDAVTELMRRRLTAE